MNKFFTLLIVSVLLFPSLAHADWLIDRSGTLIQVDGSVLGDNDPLDDKDQSVNDNEDEDESDDDSDDNDTNESAKRQIESRSEAAKQQQEKSRELLKQQTEARLKIQEISGRKSNVEIKTEAGKFKLKQEIKDANGKLIRKQEIEIKEGESFHIEQEDGETVQIDALKDGRLEMIKNRIRTTSDLELKLGEKNEISVTLPNGKTKEVSLPDQALERLIANGVIVQNAGEESNYTLIAGKNGDPIYEVEGQVEKKLLGLFKLKFAQTIAVAAAQSDDGTIVAGDVIESESQETSPWRRLLERLSIN